MASLNKVMIIGRCGRDPELRYTQSGSAIANLTIATDESYRDKDGNKVEQTEWHRVVLFQKTAETCGKYLKKGSQVYVEGRLTTRKYTDQNGVEKFTTEIRADRVQFLDSRRDNAGQGEQQSSRPTPAQAQNYATQTAFPSESASGMDDIPF